MNAKPSEIPPQALNIERPSEVPTLDGEPGIFDQDEIAWLKDRFDLTDPEVDTLNLAGQGKTTEEIGDVYEIGEEDVRQRLCKEIYPKLGALNCVNAVAIVLQGLRQGYDLLDPPNAAPAAWTPPSSAFAEHRRRQRKLGLTPTESKVVALAARGFSNREIAGALAIKVRDPETAVKEHLNRIWEKQEMHGFDGRSRIKTILYTYGVSGQVPVMAREEFALSQRQSQVLELAAQDLGNEQIAAQLWLGLDTIKTHVKALLRKTGARNRTHLVAIACGIVYSPLYQAGKDEVEAG